MANKWFFVVLFLCLSINFVGAMNVSLITPEESSYGIQPITLTLTSSPPAEVCWWTVDNSTTNTTFTPYSTEIGGLIFKTHYLLEVYCNDSSGSIGSDRTTFIFEASYYSNEAMTWIFCIILITWISLLILGCKTHNPFWFFLAGATALLFGVYIVINGFSGLNNILLERGLGVIFLSIGLYSVLGSSLEWIKMEETK